MVEMHIAVGPAAVEHCAGPGGIPGSVSLDTPGKHASSLELEVAVPRTTVRHESIWNILIPIAVTSDLCSTWTTSLAVRYTQ